MGRKKEEPKFNNPFAAAADKLKKAIAPPPAPPAPKRPAAPPPKAAPPPQVPEVLDDERLFVDEMMGVSRIDPDPRGRVGAPEPAPRPVSRRDADEAEAYAELADLIEGVGQFNFTDTDEYIEGIAPGLDKRLLRRLRKGDFALQGHVDLHGMNREEARAAVEDFLTRARSSGKRCVLIVHGRGLHSKDSIPVLKERIKAWLERGRIAKWVLAFASARPCDGGAGAVYVLLRK